MPIAEWKTTANVFSVAKLMILSHILKFIDDFFRFILSKGLTLQYDSQKTIHIKL